MLERVAEGRKWVAVIRRRSHMDVEGGRQWRRGLPVAESGSRGRLSAVSFVVVKRERRRDLGEWFCELERMRGPLIYGYPNLNPTFQIIPRFNS